MWACLLMALGTVVWFLPPMVARFLYADQVLGMDIKEPATASYAVIAQNLLPNGLMGLMLAAMLAATMSSMDTGLNNTTGIIVNNIIPRIREKLGKKALSDRTGLLLCRAFTILLGVYIIVIGLLLALQKEISLFDAYLMISAVVGLPLSMPILMGLWIKRLHWASYYIIIGMALIPSIYFVISSAGGTSWTIQDRLAWIYGFSLLGCLISLPLWKYASSAYREQVRAFYEKMHRPVDFSEEIGQSEDAFQYKIIGSTAVALGILIMLFLFVPNSLGGRLQILALGSSVAVVGALLLWRWKKLKVQDPRAERS